MYMRSFKSGFAILSILVCTAQLVWSQDPYLQKDNELAEQQATALMKIYQDDLGMTVEQALLFKTKATEFMIRHNKIQQDDLPPAEKIGRLKMLSRQETAEMANILTRPQHRVYKKLKKRYQPIAVVVGEVQPK